MSEIKVSGIEVLRLLIEIDNLDCDDFAKQTMLMHYAIKYPGLLEQGLREITEALEYMRKEKEQGQ